MEYAHIKTNKVGAVKDVATLVLTGFGGSLVRCHNVRTVADFKPAKLTNPLEMPVIDVLGTRPPFPHCFVWAVQEI